MRYRDLIDDEEFVKERDRLKAELLKMKLKLEATEDRAELMEKTFNFACYARAAFTEDDVRKRREIFASLGQNFVLKGKK